MDSCGSMRPSHVLDGQKQIKTVIESSTLARISAYTVENRIKVALEADFQQRMVVKANIIENNKIGEIGESPISEGQRLDCIYKDEPLGFEKDPLASDDKLFKEFKNCFAWDYDEMPGLIRDLVELKLSIRPNKRTVKYMPKRFAPKVISNIKEEIKRLVWNKFIRTARYVEWLANIVYVIKKNGTLKVCIDFRDLNIATPKDECQIPVAEMLVDSIADFEYLSILDCYSRYNQIYIAKEDVLKLTFQCPKAL